MRSPRASASFEARERPSKAYGLSGGLALIGASVTAMAVAKQVSDAPAAQPVMIASFGNITAAFALLGVRLA